MPPTPTPPPSSLRPGARPCAAALAKILAVAFSLLLWAPLAPPVASAAAPTFERSVYGTATVTENGDRTVVRVESGSGGLRLSTVLDPAKSYRLVVDGRSEGDPINMRLSFDQRLDYRVTEARDFVRISGTTEFEVLLYSDTPATYQLAAAELHECSNACGTEADLQALVLDQTPGLDSALAADDKRLAADLLLEWAAARIPMGSVALNTGPLSAAELYFDYFRPLERGVDCGGAADFLYKLFGLFNIPSFTVDFGTRVDGLTHVVVVLPGDRPGAPRWRVVDPSFAMTLRVPALAGDVSLEQILEAERVGLSSQIEPALGDLSDRTVVLVRGAGEDPERVRCRDGDHEFSVCSLAGYGRSFDPLLIRNGFSAGLPGILELLRRGELYQVNWRGVPAEFVAMQERFRSAASEDDTTTVLSELPLRPILARPTALAGGSRQRDQLSLSPLDWHPRAVPDAFTIGWQRCTADGGGCRNTGTAGSTYILGVEDVGQRLRAVVDASNSHGRTTSPSPLSDVVTALASETPSAAATPLNESGTAPGAEGKPHETASHVSRVRASWLSARTVRSRVRRAGLRYTTTGRLTPPRGMPKNRACSRGYISLRVTRGAVVLSLRPVRLRPDCTYRSSLVFRDRARSGRRHLRFAARFRGNDLLRPRSAATQSVTGLLFDSRR